MKERITDEQLIELIEAKANQELDQLIEKDTSLKRRVEELREVLQAIESANPAEIPAHIGLNVQQAVRDEEAKAVRGFSWMQVAAAITILIMGFAMGKFSDSSSSELAALRGEVASLKEVTMTSALQRYSASERIMAVNQIERGSGEVNAELIATLVNTLNSDESPNVRYAALQALSNYTDNDEVRAELVKSLESQKDALIQVSLIILLVEAEERSAIAPLREILDREEISTEVKKQAAIAIQVLT